RAFHVPRGLTSVADTLDLPDVDAITIATPPLTHAAVVPARSMRASTCCVRSHSRAMPLKQGSSSHMRSVPAWSICSAPSSGSTPDRRCSPGPYEGLAGDPRLAMFLLHVPVLENPNAELPDWWADAAQGGGWLGAHGSQVIHQ